MSTYCNNKAHTGSGMFQLEVLIFELVSVNALVPGTIVIGEGKIGKNDLDRKSKKIVTLNLLLSQNWQKYLLWIYV